MDFHSFKIFLFLLTRIFVGQYVSRFDSHKINYSKNVHWEFEILIVQIILVTNLIPYNGAGQKINKTISKNVHWAC